MPLWVWIVLAVLALAGAVGYAVTHAGQRRPRVYDLRGKVVVVTGATSGIGMETATALARGGATVVITARDPQKGATVVEGIRERSASPDVHVMDLDLSSLASVRAFATAFEERFDRLDVLVNNAGGVQSERHETEDGFEASIGVNHLGPFLLTNLLLPRLEASAPSRIVNVSSLAHHQAELDLDDLNWERRPYSMMGAYGASKLANILHARELARRLAGAGVTANSLHPGTIRSGFGKDAVVAWWFRAGVTLGGLFMPSAEQGASTSVYVAADPELEGVSGHYFSRRRDAIPSTEAQDDDLARRLWEVSAQTVGLG